MRMIESKRTRNSVSLEPPGGLACFLLLNQTGDDQKERVGAGADMKVSSRSSESLAVPVSHFASSLD